MERETGRRFEVCIGLKGPQNSMLRSQRQGLYKESGKQNV